MNIYAFADEASPLVDGQIAAMQRNGLNGLEIRNVEGTNVSDLTREQARQVRKKLDDAGLETWSIGSPIGKINIETDDWQAHLERFRNTLEVAHELGAGNIRMFSFFIPADRNPQDYCGQVVDRLGQMLELAHGTGIFLCHENEKGIYGDTAPRCLELFRQLPELKGIFDPANFIQCGQETMEGWKLLHPYIRYMHIKDALADGSVVPAGFGVGHLAEILKQFREQGGNAVTVEPHLSVFAGLSQLEREGQKSRVGVFHYASADDAFDAACDAFKKLI